jgi:hypothetical protein
MRYVLIISLVLWIFSAAAQQDPDAFKYSIKSKSLGEGKARITAVERSSGKPVYEIVLHDLYTNHYYSHEFHNGNLYIIHRTGGPDGYAKYPDTWTDALWKYDANKKGTSIYAVRGLDFRVSPNEKHVAVFTEDSLIILNPKGKIIRQFAAADFESGGFKNVCFANNSMFFSNGGPEASVDMIVKMNLSDFTWIKHDLNDLRFDDDFAFNPFNEMIVGSNYPWHVDADSHDEWKKGKPTVTLILCDLRSHKRTVIATSIAKEFHPAWIDSNHIAYDDPFSSKRIVREIKR